MRKIIRNILFICACILAVSCGGNDIDKLLDQVENIVAQQPDTALKMLDSIRNPIKTPEQQIRYNLLALYTRDLNDEDISNDKTIDHVIKYLDRANKLKHLAFAEYYRGRISQAQGKSEEALQFYMKAKTNAESSDDGNIKGLICSHTGDLYYKQKKYEKAAGFFKSALQYFRKSQDNYKREIAVLNNIGNCFLMNKVKDSAMVYYNESLQLARTTQDSAGIIQNLGVAYLEINELNNAKQQSLIALGLKPDSALQSLIYLNIAKVYERKKLMDSAIYFAELSTNFLTKQKNKYAFATNYKLLSRLEKKNGNYYKALFYIDKYLEHYTKIKEENVIDIQEGETKYELSVLQHEQQRYKTERFLYWAILGILITVILFLIYTWKKKQERNSLELVEIKDTLTKIQSVASEKEKIRKLYRSILENNHNDIEKHLPQMLPVEKTWSEVYNTGKLTFDKIKEIYPTLTDHEFKILCLEYLGYTNTMIANTIDLRKNTVQQSKSNIRRKLGIEERGIIYMFIAKQMESDN